jgi:hypothetical protein
VLPVLLAGSLQASTVPPSIPCALVGHSPRKDDVPGPAVSVWRFEARSRLRPEPGGPRSDRSATATAAQTPPRSPAAAAAQPPGLRATAAAGEGSETIPILRRPGGGAGLDSAGDGGRGGEDCVDDQCVDPCAMTRRQRFAATLRLWPYTVPLFIVYWAGAWGAGRLPGCAGEGHGCLLACLEWLLLLGQTS